MCDTGFDGEDCSVSVRAPPEVEGVADALCDVTQGPCLFFFVRGFGFLDHSSLTCHYTLAENNVRSLIFKIILTVIHILSKQILKLNYRSGLVGQKIELYQNKLA